MKKHKTPKLEELEKQRKKLLVSKENPKRLEEIEKYLNHLYYGI